MAEYPTSAHTLDPQNTGADDPGNAAIANAANYNRLDEEIKAISDDLRSAFGLGAGASIEDAVQAILDGYTDGRVWIAAPDWVDGDASGKWVRNSGGGIPIWNRPASATKDENLVASTHILTRAAASRGFKITKIDWVYEIKTAAVAVDVILTLTTTTLNGDGVNPSGAIPSVTFDSNHDTAAKRRAVAKHTATMTIDTPAWEVAGHGLFLNVDDTGGGTAVVDFYGAYVHFERAVVEVG